MVISKKMISKYKHSYYANVCTIDTNENACLIRYFAESFFHDAVLVDFKTDIINNSILFSFYRIDDYEDLNDYRKENSLPKLKWREFQKKPIIYRVNIKNIFSFSYNCEPQDTVFDELDFLENDNNNKTVMDTEIIADKDGKHSLNILFQDDSMLTITGGKYKVVVLTSMLISEFTCGKRKRMPYCDLCKSKLITKNDITKLKSSRSE